MRARLLLFLALLLSLLLAASVAVVSLALPRRATLPDLSGPADYVGRASCEECHPEPYAAWTGSQHDQAMDVAREESVLGDFDDASFTRFGTTSRFFTRDGRFFVNTDGPDGVLRDYEILYTFGVYPLQQYLVGMDAGRLQALSICWDVVGKRWFHLYDEPIPHDDELHWTRPSQNWNYMCAECHSTNLRKNYDVDRDVYSTTWSEIDVSCEACHGPSSHHVAWARWAEETDAEYEVGDAKGLEVLLRGGDAATELETCAPCHSRRLPVHGDDWRHGEPYLDNFQPRLLISGRYRADGQILDEVYVYGSWRQSRMHRKGVTCSHCHDPHSARMRLEGNLMCQRCHKEEPPKEFETLKSKEYDTKEHHFHEPGKEGSLCVDCHMVSRNYMVVDPRHDHSMQLPRPELTRDLGIPNACNGCHDDQTVEWSLQYLAQWYPERSSPAPGHFAYTLSAAREGRPEALQRLIALAGDEEQAIIVRATALHELAAYRSPLSLRAMVAVLDHEDPLLRVTAAEGLSALIPRNASEQLVRAKAAWLAPLLRDPLRAVRVEAARAIAEVPAGFLGADQYRDFQVALEEFKRRQAALSDRPGAHLNLGVLYSNLGDVGLAESSYRKAIEMDPRFLPARFNLANLLNGQQRNAEAEMQLRGILAVDASQGDAYFSLGLLLAEMDRLDEAADSLAEAARLLPGRARIHYNHSLVLQHLKRFGEAEQALLRAGEGAPGDPDIVNALVVFYVQQGEWKRALPHARRLVELMPGARGPREMLARIERAAAE